MTTAIILKSYIAISRVIATTSTLVANMRGEVSKIKKAYDTAPEKSVAHA